MPLQGWDNEFESLKVYPNGGKMSKFKVAFIGSSKINLEGQILDLNLGIEKISYEISYKLDFFDA